MENLRKYFAFLFAIGAIFFVSNFVGDNVTLANVNNITGIVFVTEPKNLAVDEISGGITIQAQNSSGTGEKMEVAGGKMTITSSGGEISPSATNWENLSGPLTVNSNWTGRTVYYKNSSAGTYTITAMLDVSGKSWTATQNITIGDSTPVIPTPPDDTGEGTSTTTATTTTTTTATSTATSTAPQIIYVSAHCSQENLSGYVEPTVFEVSAGRDRLSYVNLSVSFVAKYKVSEDITGKSCNYVWSFGDGASSFGEKVEHVYKYAGDYNVVLNGSCGHLNSVSRTMVKVATPNLAISEKDDGSVEVSNQGKYEINLYGWKLQSLSQAYTFPLDTIISAGQSVIFPAEYLKIPTSGNEVVLINTAGNQLAQTGSNFAVSNSENIISRAEFEEFALEYKKLTTRQHTTLTAINTTAPSPSLTNEGRRETPVPLMASVASLFINATGSDVQVDNAEVPVSTEAPTRGFWSKLFHPIRTIREAFYQ